MIENHSHQKHKIVALNIYNPFLKYLYGIINALYNEQKMKWSLTSVSNGK